ncbi:hypothetical protein PN465_06670 [Nodularia spumigena CS-584]|nr:hypothetical protein [Nodularia spumigena]AHJ27589.1 hypothetical protein NSP_12490 [Nodularia spumigena CCY9414]MDB9381904.1 hypothetical protein [Nodularia spumigena CS-584]
MGKSQADAIGVDETVVPDVRLRRSPSGDQGKATFTVTISLLLRQTYG